MPSDIVRRLLVLTSQDAISVLVVRPVI